MMANIQVSATTFYVTTGTHGAHVLGGIIGLTYMTLKAAKGGNPRQRGLDRVLRPLLALRGPGLGPGLPILLSILR